MKEMRRQERREAMVRMKGRARRVLEKWRGTEVSDPRQIGKVATTPWPCSCHMCGNARKWQKGKGGQLTLQEQRENEKPTEIEFEEAEEVQEEEE